jgi:hypothetical protein
MAIFAHRAKEAVPNIFLQPQIPTATDDAFERDEVLVGIRSGKRQGVGGFRPQGERSARR